MKKKKHLKSKGDFLAEENVPVKACFSLHGLLNFTFSVLVAQTSDGLPSNLKVKGSISC